MRSTITIDEAKALADDWKVQRDEHERQPHADYFSDASPHDLIAMWETNKRKDGRKLNQYEVGCLIEAWCKCFNCLPPTDGSSVEAERIERGPLPADDKMLRMPDIEHLTGMSKSTIKRMVNDGRFPKPMRIGIRAKGWPARDLKHYFDVLEEQRRRPRQ